MLDSLECCEAHICLFEDAFERAWLKGLMLRHNYSAGFWPQNEMGTGLPLDYVTKTPERASGLSPVEVAR